LVLQVPHACYLSFKVERPMRHSSMVMIQKRTTTCVSFQPLFSKWWCKRRHLEDAPALAVALLGELEPGHLQHHGKRLDDEDAPHDGQHDFLAHDDRDGAQRGAQRQRAHVAHEDLGRVRVEPQKGQAGAGHGRAEDQQLARTGDVREEQVFGVDRAAGHVSEHAQRRAHHDHGHDGQAVQAVGQVDGVAGAHDHEVGQDHKAEHAERVADFLDEGHEQTGLGRQVHVKARLHPAEEQLEHAHVGTLGNAEHQVQRRDQPDDGLPHVFLARAHAFRVLEHDLAPVVRPADGAEAQRDDEDDPDEAVGQVEPQQRGDADGQQDQHPAHGGRAALAQVRLHRVFADGLAYLQRDQPADHKGPGQQADQQRRERGHHGAESQVLEHPEEPELGRNRLEPLGQTKQHGARPSAVVDDGLGLAHGP
jgi:hypothetical protein